MKLKSKVKKFTLCIVLILIVGLGFYFLIGKDIDISIKRSNDAPDVTLDDALELEFKKVVLGKTTAETNLIVMEQEVSVVSTLQENGLFKWGVFTKNKDVKYIGKAVYAVNFKYLEENDIIVNSETKTIMICVPHPEMYDLIMDPNDFVLNDTTKGWFAFGDIKLTLEEAFYIQQEAYQKLKAAATDEDVLNKASEIAETQVTEFFSKIIQSVSPEYNLVIKMYG